jgi:hypothetical protein
MTNVATWWGTAEARLQKRHRDWQRLNPAELSTVGLRFLPPLMYHSMPPCINESNHVSGVQA